MFSASPFYVPSGTEPRFVTWAEMEALFGGEISGTSTGAVRTPMVIGQTYLDVDFVISQPDTNWELTECMVVNTSDSNPLNIWPGIISRKTQAGFRIHFNGAPDSANYYLHYAIAGTGGGGDVSPPSSPTNLIATVLSTFPDAEPPSAPSALIATAL